jgi:hypothetical protein
MNINEHEYKCRVCGFEHETPTWEYGDSPSYDICHCCGVEFGYSDFTVLAVKNFRKKWIENGAKWSGNISFKPNNWNVESQMKNIDEIFL